MKLLSHIQYRLAILIVIIFAGISATTDHILPVRLVRLNIQCNTQPLGTIIAQTDDPEPTIPVWCLDNLISPQKTGNLDGFGGWIDLFNNNISGNNPAHINDNEIGYHTYEDISAGGGQAISQHWEANNYFVADLNKGALDNGTDLSPAQSFAFQNGKLVLEGDIAASEPGFADASGADNAWAEIDWSTRPNPDASTINDNLYLYGYFRGAYSAGCRLQAHRSLTCAVEADHDLASVTGDQAPCYSVSPARVIEMSGHQQCGSIHSGFSVDFGAPSDAWRICPQGTVDPCLDRFRLEWSQNGFVAYVNGIKFAEDSNWPTQALFPSSITNGSTPIYAHFGEFGDFTDNNVYRFHWGRIAVNPHNSNGSLMTPSASPTFGATPPTPSPTPSISPTPILSPSPFACKLTFNNQTLKGHCLRQTDGSIRFTQP
jgi:hypothetical protein